MSVNKMIGIMFAVLVFSAIVPEIAQTINATDGNFSGASLVLYGLIILVTIIVFIKSMIGHAKDK